MNAVVRTCAEADYVNGSCIGGETIWNSPFFIAGTALVLVAAVVVGLLRAIRSSGRPPWK